MAVDVSYSAVDYAGNGSTSTPYPVEFPVFEAADIYVAVKLDGETDFNTLSSGSGEYSVTDLGDGDYEVRTAVAYTAADTVRVFRGINAVQPFEFPEGGRFPARSVERALDRLLMLIQQVRLEAGLLGGTIFMPGLSTAVTSFTYATNAAHRATLQPAYAGQLLIQLDSGQLYEGLSTAAGDWDEYGD